MPLLPQHVEVLLGYIQDKVEPHLSPALSGIAAGAAVVGRGKVLDSITKAEFQHYFDNLKATKAVADPGWANVPPPYAITKEFAARLKPENDRIWEEQDAWEYQTKD